MQEEEKIVKTRRRYILEAMRNVLRALSENTQKRVAELSGTPLRTVQNFVRERDVILTSIQAKRSRHLGQPGRPEILPGGTVSFSLYYFTHFLLGLIGLHGSNEGKMLSLDDIPCSSTNQG